MLCCELDLEGMNYVAAVLLMLLNESTLESQDEGEPSENSSDSPEETAFWILYALIRNQGMADIWRSKMPG